MLCFSNDTRDTQETKNTSLDIIDPLHMSLTSSFSCWSSSGDETAYILDMVIKSIET